MITQLVRLLEAAISSMPLQLLEIWGRFGYLVGFALALFAFSGFTFRPGGTWGVGRERQAWDGKAFSSMALTFVLIIGGGYLGSSIVLVPGAQTFESLKDLVVFLCIVLFGFPALVVVPFAYGLADLIEGVPPNFILAWLPGYFINPTCFWIAYQLFGRNPDFRRAKTWGLYFLFVVAFTTLEPILWGFICSEQFTPELSYRTITPALLFTTSITWVLAPIAMLGAFPLARRFGLFWADIPGHVRERSFTSPGQRWETGKPTLSTTSPDSYALPLRVYIVAPFVTLVLVMVGVAAYVTLESAEDSATKLATRLHQEIADSMKLRLDDYLANPTRAPEGVSQLLAELPIAQHGRAVVLDAKGNVVGSSVLATDAVVDLAVARIKRDLDSFANPRAEAQFTFDYVSTNPLARETWLANIAPYTSPGAEHRDWILLTAMPQAYYLAGIRAGNSRSAMVFAVALLLSLAIAAPLASAVTTPLRRISKAANALAHGDLTQRVPTSSLEELATLAGSFNDMAAKLDTSFDDLVKEVEQRKRRERELEESQEKQVLLANILRQTLDGVLVTDLDGNIIQWNKGAELIFGYTAEEVLGKPGSLLNPGDEAGAQFLERKMQEASHGFTRYEEVRKRKDGRLVQLDINASPLKDDSGKLIGYSAIYRDITERKRVEAELENYRTHLEQMVETRTAELEKATKVAEAANSAKSKFLAHISHEIRTPMNAILGYGQLMERESDLASRDRERLVKIMASSHHLLDLVNNVLEMSKIEAGYIAVSSQPFDLHEALAVVDAMARRLIETRGLSFTTRGVDSLPRYVRSDVAKLRQILINVLGNAAKFTQTGSVTLECRADAGDDDTILLFQVTDTGAGIPPGEIDKIFEPFVQSEGGSRKQAGTGLGLAISRDLARRLGGDLTVSSVQGKGTTFKLEVRVDSAELSELSTPPILPKASALVGQGRALKVLIADDEEDNRAFLRDFLKGEGIAVFEANDGEAAVERFVATRPDFVFMDVNMPRLDGVEAIRRIRELPEGAKVPIVVLSASVLDDHGSSVLRTGGSQFIAKPYPIAEILNALERHLGLQVAPPEAEAPRAGQTDITREQVAALGAEVITAMREAMAHGYVQRIPGLLAGLGPEHARSVEMLCHLAREFEIDRLRALL